MSITKSRVSEALNVMAKIIPAGRLGPLYFLVVLACFGLLEVIWKLFEFESFAGAVVLGVANLVASIISLVRLQHFVVYESLPAQDGLLGLWSERETRTLGYAIAFVCMLILAVVVFMPMVTPTTLLSGNGLLDEYLSPQLQGAGLAFVFMLPLIYITSRLCFVFPAAAVNSPCTFSDSWDLTKVSALNLTLVSCVLLVPGPAIEYAATNREVFWMILGGAWDFISLVFWATYVALAYRNAIQATPKRLPM